MSRRLMELDISVDSWWIWTGLPGLNFWPNCPGMDRRLRFLPETVTKYSHQHLDPVKIIGEEPWDISLTSMCSNIDPSNLVVQKAAAANHWENKTRQVSEHTSGWSVWGGVGGQPAPCWSSGWDTVRGRRALLDPARLLTFLNSHLNFMRWKKQKKMCSVILSSQRNNVVKS